MTEVATEAGLAKVIYVIDDAPVPSRLVINRGSRHGVKVGDRFLVFGYGPDLKDPDTGENLGRLEIVRGRGQVVHVQDDMATLKSLERRFRRPARPLVRDLPAGALTQALLGRTVLDDALTGPFFGAGRAIEDEVEPEQDMPFHGAALGDLAKPI